MRYNELVEGKWWEDGDTITLYHGTSSALIPNIKQDGLVPPPADLKKYFGDLFQHYITQIPKDAQKRYSRDQVYQQVIGSWRKPAKRDDFRSVLYFHLTKQRAKGYAKSYAKHGGEIAWHVWKAIGGKHYKIPPRFADAHPIIITAEIPRSWIKHGFNAPFDEVADRIRKIWLKNKSWEDFVEDIDTEVRVKNVVPYSMITDIVTL